MNEQIRSILAQETTKTSKIRQLYLLGVPRAEIARMVTNGNYGFVVNALRRISLADGDGHGDLHFIAELLNRLPYPF